MSHSRSAGPCQPGRNEYVSSREVSTSVRQLTASATNCVIERSKRTHGCTGCARASGARCPTTLIPNDGTIETMAPFVVRRLRRCQLDRGRCHQERPGATRFTAKARLHGGCFANEASPLPAPQAFVVDGDKSEASISTTSTSISSRSTPPVLPAGTRPSRKRRRRRATTADY